MIRPRTLREQLALGVSVIVSVAMIGIGAVAELSLRNEMVGLTNSQVANSLAAFSYSYAKAKLAMAEPDAVPAAAIELDEFPGQPPGTVIAVLRDGRTQFAARFTDGEPAAVPPDVVAELEEISWRSGDPREVTLGSLGEHQVGTRDLGGGERLVSAVSLKSANATLLRNALIFAGLLVVALIVTAAATVLLVRGALRPLRRVAGIAGQVATVPLEASEYRITARVPGRDADPGNEVGIVGLTLNHLLDNVDAALTQRAQSDRRMRQFLTDVSHELRTPLASIRGYAELTSQESDALPPMTEYALTRIEAESQRMTALVSDLLLLSRLDEGQDLEITDVDMCELVADAVNDAAVSAPDHRYLSELPDHPVVIRGDRARLQQLVANLLANAGIHTPPGCTVTASLTAGTDGAGPDLAAADAAGADVVLRVGDDGPGIPDEIMGNLFGRFVRADKARSREMGSSGLGLAIVASVAEAHHGTVSVASRPGRTTFTVRLPAAP